MKRFPVFCILISMVFYSCSQNLSRQQSGGSQATSGNPVFPDWYADSEGIIFGKEYWIYLTYSAPYEQQVFMDAFSSPDLVTWTKHDRIVDTGSIKWADKAM